MNIVFVIAMTLLVGFLCGSTSVGGVLLIPALGAALPQLGLRTIMGTVLLSFFFAGLVGTYLHFKAGRIDWPAAVPLCLGCLLAGYPGAVAKEHISVPALNAILAVAIVVAGVTALRPAGGGDGGAAPAPNRARWAQLFLIGVAVSFLSAMTGAGGPVLSVPIMLALGYGPIMTIAVAQPLQVAVTLSGSVGNIVVGAIDYPVALLITVLMMIGVAGGVYAVRMFRPDVLKRIVAWMCVATGGFMLLASAFG